MLKTSVLFFDKQKKFPSFSLTAAQVQIFVFQTVSRRWHSELPAGEVLQDFITSDICRLQSTTTLRIYHSSNYKIIHIYTDYSANSHTTWIYKNQTCLIIMCFSIQLGGLWKDFNDPLSSASVCLQSFPSQAHHSAPLQLFPHLCKLQ